MDWVYRDDVAGATAADVSVETMSGVRPEYLRSPYGHRRKRPHNHGHAYVPVIFDPRPVRRRWGTVTRRIRSFPLVVVIVADRLGLHADTAGVV